MKSFAPGIFLVLISLPIAISAQKYEQQEPFYSAHIELNNGKYYLEEQHCLGMNYSAGTYTSDGDTLYFLSIKPDSVKKNSYYPFFIELCNEKFIRKNNSIYVHDLDKWGYLYATRLED